MGLLIFLSFAAGLFLGVPIVARELERGTARLAWSLAPSRMRWFLARMLPILVVLALVTFLGGHRRRSVRRGDHGGNRPVELVHELRLPRAPDRQPGGLRLRGRGRRRRDRRAGPAGRDPRRGHRDHRPGRRRAGPPDDPGVRGRRDPDGPNNNNPQSRATCTSTRSSCCRTAASSTTATSAAQIRTTRFGNPKYPIVDARRPGRALPVRRDARGARAGRRLAGGAACSPGSSSRGGGRAERLRARPARVPSGSLGGRLSARRPAASRARSSAPRTGRRSHRRRTGRGRR